MLFSPVGQYQLAPGDLIWTDYAAFIDGYPSNLSRIAVVGEPTLRQRKLYANLLGGHRRIMEFMRPGVTGQEVFAFAIQAYADRGYLTNNRTILGHSLGLGYHERPMLTAAETMPLAATMVFALEPVTVFPFHLQDQVVVGEHDTYLQSDLFDTYELYVVDA
jgi:Xaa-Pro aminopeptidase